MVCIISGSATPVNLFTLPSLKPVKKGPAWVVVPTGVPAEAGSNTACTIGKLDRKGLNSQTILLHTGQLSSGFGAVTSLDKASQKSLAETCKRIGQLQDCATMPKRHHARISDASHIRASYIKTLYHECKIIYMLGACNKIGENTSY